MGLRHDFHLYFGFLYSGPHLLRLERAVLPFTNDI